MAGAAWRLQSRPEMPQGDLDGRSGGFIQFTHQASNPTKPQLRVLSVLRENTNSGSKMHSGCAVRETGLQELRVLLCSVHMCRCQICCRKYTITFNYYYGTFYTVRNTINKEPSRYLAGVFVD